MKTVYALTVRNTRLFFRDKGMFFTSLLTPMILLILYATFLANIYEDSFTAMLSAGVPISERLIDGAVAGQLLSSLLAVSAVTVTFCSNMLMVQDKVNGARRDLAVSPVRSSQLALGYYISTALTSLLVCFSALAVGLIYTAARGWYLSVSDVLLLFLDTFLLVMFGTAFSSIINYFLTSQGQISAVGTVVSAGYGFVCGAYMPISQFGEGLRNAVMLSPGTYGTGLLRRHALSGVLAAMEKDGTPREATEAMREMVDMELSFFGNSVSEAMMYLVLSGSALILIGVYLIINAVHERRENAARCRSAAAAASLSAK